MTSPRRFDDREIALIFEQASVAQNTRVDVADPADGLTLEQLQEIGREVGLAPEHIARAAHAVTRGDLLPTRRRTWLGLPVGVSRTIEFGRTVSDDEWNRLVGLFRETFEARGRIRTDGPFRQWTNGNLQALLEPTEHGHRLRLSTRKGDAQSRVIVGTFFLGMAVLLAGLGLVGDLEATRSVLVSAFFATMGVVSIGSTLVTLPRWARIRASQMEAIAAHTAAHPSPPHPTP